MESIQDQLTALQAEIAHNDSIDYRLKEISESIKELLKQEFIHRAIIDKELNDLKKIEKLTVKSLFVRFLGDMQERLEKEKQEYLMAVLQHQSILEEIDTLEYEQQLLKKKFVSKKQLKIQHNKLIRLKEISLKKRDSAFFKQMVEFDKDIAKYNAQIRKYDLAMERGTEARELLRHIETELCRVQDWGMTQMYGKGAYSTMAKKSYIDKARSHVIRAHVLLENFEKRLHRVYDDALLEFNLETFETFINDFYDNLITDWIIQTKLRNALNGVTSSHDKVQRWLYTLKMERNELADLKTDVEQERIRFIESYNKSK